MTKKLSLEAIKYRERMQLPNRVLEAEQDGRLKINLAILLLLLPFLLFALFEFGGRIIDPPLRPLSKPWKAYSGPYPPLSQYKWTGDLTRMARIPYFDRLVENSPFPARFTHRITDEWGFVNRPRGQERQPIDKNHRIVLTGTSYMAEGSTIDHTFASQLEKNLEESVYNASFPSAGPSDSLLKVLTDTNFCSGKEDILILGIIQRYLYDWAFNEINAYIAEDGTILKHKPTDPKPDPTFKDYLEWRKTIESYLEQTSHVRKWAANQAAYLPPMAFDLGLQTPVQVSWLTKEPYSPILFFNGDIASTYHDYHARGGDNIVQALARVKKACDRRDTRFLVALVPDKYELYRTHLDPRLYPQPIHPSEQRPQHPEHRAPELFVKKLADVGVEALDLYPPLYEAQFKNGCDNLLFWINDTHWSDHGIQVAAAYLANYLNETK